MDTAAITARLATIEAILDQGVASVTVDGRTTVYDLGQLEITAQRLRRQLANAGTSGRMRTVRYNPAYSE